MVLKSAEAAHDHQLRAAPLLIIARGHGS